MELDRIAELLEPFLLSSCGENSSLLTESQLSSISTYLDLLLRWNARINLTAINDPEKIVTRHFGESLFAARHIFPVDWDIDDSSSKDGPHVIDVGSGAGFPGIPVKIWAAKSKLTLIESTNKKATFLREVIRSLRLDNSTVFAARAEMCEQQGDVVTLRAVEKFETALPAALRLVKPQGRVALLIGESQVDLATKLAARIRWTPPLPIPLSSKRVLLIGHDQSD
jgi:16S rRNA (guanine527-N7)-methyltransferase